MMRLIVTLLSAALMLFAGCQSEPETSTPAATRPPTSSATAAPDTVATTTVPQINVQVTPIITQDVPTATPACVGLPRTRLTVGNRAQVNDDDETPLNVRSGPSTEFRILGRLTVLERFIVLDGPECSDEYVWYQVRSDSGLEGWIAEGISGLYFIEPYPPG